MNYIGSVSSGFRFIRNGSEFNSLFPKAANKDHILLQDADVHDTVKLMAKIVQQTKGQTAKLAKQLQRPTLHETCKAVWDFLYHHIQYKLDEKGLEQLRQPARSWHDRKSGIDCDCFSIFVSSILTNLGISHAFRITKYDHKPNFQHVYVIVPLPQSNRYYTIDCVLPRFDYEKPYTDKKDFIMTNDTLNGIDVAVLSGFDATTTDEEYFKVISGAHFEAAALGSISEEEAVYQHLLSTRKIVAEKPYLIAAIDDPQAFLEMLDYAIEHWNTPNRDEALAILAQNEAAVNGLNGFDDNDELCGDDELEGDDDDSLGKTRRKKMFKKIRQAVATKRVNQKALPACTETMPPVPDESRMLPAPPENYGEESYQDPYGGEDESEENLYGYGFGKAKTTPDGKKKPTFFKKVGEGLKKVGKAIVRFNPVTIAARGGFLMALKLNISKISSKLKWGYATEAQAKAKGISKSQWLSAKKSLADAEKIFEKIGGKPKNMRKPILSGKAGNLNGVVEYNADEDPLEGLGSAAAAASIAAAIPIIAKIITSLKKNKLMTDDEATQAEKELHNSKGILEKSLKENPDEFAEDTRSQDAAASAGNDKPPGKDGMPKWVLPVVGVAVVGGIGLYLYSQNKKKKRAAGLSGVARRKKNPRKITLKRIELR